MTSISDPSIGHTDWFEHCIIHANCMEYPLPNIRNTQWREYPIEKLGIMIVGYSGQNVGFSE